MKKSGKILSGIAAVSLVAGMCVMPAVAPEMSVTAYAEATNYTWALKPSEEFANCDINAVYEKSGFSDANVGYFMESPYSLMKTAGQAYDAYILIDYNGKKVDMPYSSQYRSEANNHIQFWSYATDLGDRTPVTSFCTKGGEFIDLEIMTCALCGLSSRGTSVSGWFAYYDENNKLLYGFAYEPFGFSHPYTNREVSMNGEGNRGKVTGDYFGTVGSATIDEDNKQVSFDCKYGILKNGEMVVGFDDGYDNALTYKDGVTALRKDGKWYYFDENGNQMTNIPACDGELALEGVINSNGTILEYTDYVPYLPSDGYIAVNNENGGGYYDVNGNCIIDVGEFEAVRPVYDGKAWVKYDGKWGVIDIANNSTPVSTTTTTTTATTTETTTTTTNTVATITATAINTSSVSTGSNNTTVTTNVPATITTTTASSTLIKTTDTGKNVTTGTGSVTENNVSSTTTTDNNNNSNDSDDNDNNSGNNNSSSNSTGKESPKTGVAGVGMAMTGIAVAIGTTFIFRKKNN